MKSKMKIFLVTLLMSFGVQGFAQTLTGKKGDNGKLGFVDDARQWIIQPLYDGCPSGGEDCYSFIEGLASVKLNKKCGFIDKTGKTVIPFNYEDGNAFSEGLASVKLNGKWGFIDKTGKMVIPPQFEGADSFNEGLAPAWQNKKYGYIDKTGTWIIKPQFGWTPEPFKNGFAQVRRDATGNFSPGRGLNFKCGLMDKKGNIVVPMDYHGFPKNGYVDDVPTIAWIFGDNENDPTQYFLIQSDWKIIPVEGRLSYAGEGLYISSGFYINRNGEKVIPINHRHVGNFEEGKALVQMPDGKYVFINRQGSVVFAFDYDEMNGFESNGLARVKLDEKFGYADKQGNLVIPCIYDSIDTEGFINGYAKVKRDGIRFQIDSTGKEVKKMVYDPNSFSEGLAVASSTRDGRSTYMHCIGYIDRNENVIIPFDENRGEARNFSEGFAAVRCGKWGFIDKTGKLIIPYSYDGVTDFKDGIAYVYNSVRINRKWEKKWGCINQSGKVVAPLNFSSKEAAQKAVDLTISLEQRINDEIVSARQTKDYKLAAKKLSELAKQTEKHLDYKATLPESWENSMAKVYNELGWIYYKARDYGKSVKTYGISKALKQKDGEVSIGELIAIHESGKKSTTSMDGDFFLDHYVQALKNVPQGKKVNVNQKAACLSSFVIIAFDRAKRQRDYKAAIEILDKVTGVPGMADVAREHYFALCAKETDFFTFKDAISNVYPQKSGVNFDIDYFDEEQLKTLFTQLENTSLSNETLLKYKFELLDRLPVIHSYLCEEYEKAGFEKIKEGDRLQYRDYIRRFPNGGYTRQATAKLDQLEDNLYQVAVTEGSQKSYLRYLSQFPDGRYVSEAKLQTGALSASQKAKIKAEQERAVKEEKDAIHNYIEIETQDIFFAKGDGLNYWEWLTSTGQDMKNWNVFVIAKVKNKGKLPKRIKATVTLKVIDEWSARTLFVSDKRKDILRYTDDWYMDIEPGSNNILVGYFQFQEKARAEGNILGGFQSHTYIDKKNAFDIHFDYFDENIPSSKLKAQTDLVEVLRKNGNVQIKEGYASRYYEAKAEMAYEKREKAVRQCMKCEINWEKFTVPTEKEWLGMTFEKPGIVEMKNGEFNYYYWDKEGGLKVIDYIWDQQYNTWEDMESAFMEACRAEHCSDKAIREEADRRKEENKKRNKR